MDVGEGTLNDGRTRQARQEIDVVAHAELQEKLTAQAIHVRHRQDGQHIPVVGAEPAANGFLQVGDIAPHAAVGEHYTLGEPCGATGVIDQREFVRVVNVVVEMLLAEILRVFDAVDFVEMLTGVGELLGARDDE